MALKFNSEEEAREWLKKVKSAGAAPAKSETFTLDQVLNEQPPEPLAAPVAPPEPVRAAPQRQPDPEYVRSKDDPQVSASKLTVWIFAIIGMVWAAVAVYDGSAINGETHFAAAFAAVMTGLLGGLIGVIFVAMFSSTLFKPRG
jgi:hypothetical protein